ncbi:hypothetical protein FO488_00470 [Geobacter sp. FeAm09]|uniref:hypothetical protein n=1 Tax=Geobacter sp. FeAm09 TaxID=2597769 RepID=UPI0011EFFBA7|nr:hypothetical protein [Geobacter sp. FeAm09]QEM66781.1 hypothetical protein FO488_00470 [Geobacter sp. FeAm09]
MTRELALAGLMMVLYALPVQAGHGTIRETDTEIVIEYSGDSQDKPAETKAAQPPPPTQAVPADVDRAPSRRARGQSGDSDSQETDETARSRASHRAEPPRGPTSE